MKAINGPGVVPHGRRLRRGLPPSKCFGCKVTRGIAHRILRIGFIYSISPHELDHCWIQLASRHGSGDAHVPGPEFRFQLCFRLRSLSLHRIRRPRDKNAHGIRTDIAWPFLFKTSSSFLSSRPIMNWDLDQPPSPITCSMSSRSWARRQPIRTLRLGQRQGWQPWVIPCLGVLGDGCCAFATHFQ